MGAYVSLLVKVSTAYIQRMVVNPEITFLILIPPAADNYPSDGPFAFLIHQTEDPASPPVLLNRAWSAGGGVAEPTPSKLSRCYAGRIRQERQTREFCLESLQNGERLLQIAVH